MKFVYYTKGKERNPKNKDNKRFFRNMSKNREILSKRC